MTNRVDSLIDEADDALAEGDAVRALEWFEEALGSIPSTGAPLWAGSSASTSCGARTKR